MFNKLAAIIRKDIILRFEGRSELLFFLILPLVFTFIIGGGSFGGNPDADNRIAVSVTDEDGGEPSAALLAELAGSEVIRAEARPRAAAETLLADDSVPWLLVPAGFSAALSADGIATGQTAEIALTTAPNSDVALAVEGEVARAVEFVAAPLRVARDATAGAASIRPFADEAARAAFFAGALAAAESETATRPARVEYTTLSGDSGGYDQRAQSSAGQLVTWVFIPLLGASGLYALERGLGTLRRLMTAPTRKSTFLLGSIGGQFLVALAQMVLLVLFGLYVMRVPWGNDPLALAVVLITFGLAGVALGTTLGTFVKTESQAANLSIMLGMSMALLGGCWWPMELFPPALQQVVKVLPTTWAMSALTDLSMRGGGLVDVLPEAGVMLGFAAVFFVIGVWRFRYE